jgi:hypothetical protein
LRAEDNVGLLQHRPFSVGERGVAGRAPAREIAREHEHADRHVEERGEDSHESREEECDERDEQIEREPAPPVVLDLA